MAIHFFSAISHHPRNPGVIQNYSIGLGHPITDMFQFGCDKISQKTGIEPWLKRSLYPKKLIEFMKSALFHIRMCKKNTMLPYHT